MTAQEEWDKLSPQEKLDKLEPRVFLMVKMISDARDIMNKNDLITDEYKRGLELLNLRTE